MSLSRLNYDTCTYSTNMKQSTNAAQYFLQTPRIDCHTCFPRDSSIQLGSVPGFAPHNNNVGGSTCKDVPLVEISNELNGITRKASKCPDKHYQGATKLPCVYYNPPRCDIWANESTRLTQPPCYLNGTGWNRFDYLHHDPQKDCLPPFDHNINYRLIAKDTHRPVLPQPINQSPALPLLNNSDDVYESPYVHYDKLKCGQRPGDVYIPSTLWKKCSDVESCVHDKPLQ